jgi:hypothetical protein
MWYNIPEVKNPQEFPVVIRTPNEEWNVQRAIDINNVAMCEQYSLPS